MERVLFAKGDLEQRRKILRLLSEAFGHKYIHYYELHLDTLATPESTILLEERGEIIAHIQVVPYIAKIHADGSRLKCAYLYAVCTAKSMQGKGIMSGLLKSILADELSALCYQHAILVPADEDLVGYYTKFGFHFMEGEIYLKAPKESFPAIRPSEEAIFYLSSAEELDAQFASTPTLAHSKAKWIPFKPKQVGWMSFSLDSAPLPLDTILVNPLV